LRFAISTAICCPLEAPRNGTIDCELGDDGGPNYNDTCAVSCDPGFIMTGSDSRTCTEDGTWSGDDATCIAREYRICAPNNI